MTKKELKKILQNKCSSQELASLQSWLTSGDFSAELERYITEDIESLLQKDPDEAAPALDHLVEVVIAKARAFEGANTNITARDVGRKKQISLWRRVRSIAAAAAAALVISVVFTYHYTTRQTDTKNRVVKTVTKVNTRGRKSTIFLKDGSIVYLNAVSKITFPEKFTDSVRRIALIGEAYFEVTRDEKKPFIVRAGEIDIEVLGTSFNVNAYPGNQIIKVSLNSGYVRVAPSPGESTTMAVNLKSGESVSYLQKQKQFTKVSAFDHDLDLGWKDGKLVFRNADLSSVITKLEQWYNVDFHIVNKPYFQWNYNGEFKNQVLRDVLESMSFSQNFDYTIQGNQITIKFKPN